MSKHKVTFLPGGVDISVDSDTTIMKAAREAGVELEGPCGGKGTCGKCRVRLISENGPDRWVLACRTLVEEDLTVEVPQLEVSLHKKNELTLTDLNVECNSGVTKETVFVDKPTLKNQVPDDRRLIAALGRASLEFKMESLRVLPKLVRKRKQPVTAVISEGTILNVEAGDTKERLYGVAVDIGTTTIVTALVNMLNGETLVMASASNPQSVFGADVITRIEYTMQNENGLGQLNRRVIQAINYLIDELVKEVGIDQREIYLMSVVGNTTMSHLFLKMDPRYLASSPFIPVTTDLIQVEAKELGINISPHAPVLVAPSVAGYVGGDTIGVIMSTEIYRKDGVYLAIDIGTNGEIVLSQDGKLTTCSTAAGPAFEGAQIKFGMRAAVGAIERVAIQDDVSLQVIGTAPVKGICGSGLMDAVSEMARVGIIEPTGRVISQEEGEFLPERVRARIGSEEKGNFFVLAYGKSDEDNVVLSQKDVRELQLAKSAIRAGIQILLEQSGLTYGDIDQVLLAGAFGSYINKMSALGIGILPPVSPEKISSVGNAAGAGARKLLVSRDLRLKAAKVAHSVSHVELSCRLDFQEYFIDFMNFEPFTKSSVIKSA